MADRVYPSAKQATNGTATGTNPSFSASKAQLYGASRPLYRPQPNRHRRSCCCSCCLWTTIAILVLILLSAIAGAILYVLYRPHRPTFTVSSLNVSALNISSASKLITNLNVEAKNPNKKVVYSYDPTTISINTSDDIDIGDGSFGSFVHGTKNTTLLKAAIASSHQELDYTSAGKLKTGLKSKNGLPLKIKLETKVKAKMGALKTPKLRIMVTCEGVKVSVPKVKSATTASTSNAKCKVDLKLKIWKWTLRSM
ncbi:chaperonin CPN60-like 2 [Hibiscus syriacus]|uniref:Chaperonin CPN60-like 2 n=1 Tax=Hibiscus syriacus TaxID=106335 RepID=A0A6A3A999_HIBSY|nr:chaperonin CPN60-like 2 [Hibiscus syriacus]